MSRLATITENAMRGTAAALILRVRRGNVRPSMDASPMVRFLVLAALSPRASRGEG
jgi:hypothetical protein